jgi:AraC-like DNA-binding protein
MTTLELGEIRNWAARARAAHYRVQALAEACGVSMWRLNHFFLTRTGLHAHEWLARLRQMDAICLLARGLTKKHIAATLTYSHATHFWRDFRRIHRVTPGAALRLRLTPKAALERTPLALFSLDQAPSLLPGNCENW